MEGDMMNDLYNDFDGRFQIGQSRKEQSMLQVLQFFTEETPSSITLKKLKFHRQSAQAVPVEQHGDATERHYHIYVHGQIGKNETKGPVILDHYVDHLSRQGFFDDVAVLRPLQRGEAGKLAFELVAVV